MSRKEIGLKPSSLQRNLRKKSQKLSRKKVLKMIAVMETQQVAGPSNGTDTAPVTPECAALHTQEFLASGRTGRRNALPDILGEHALVTSSDLPSRLQSLTTSDSNQSTSKESTGEPSSSTS